MTRSINLLILNRCFPPEMGATGTVARDLGRILAQRHFTTFLAGRPVETDQFKSYALIQQERQEGFTVERLGSTAFSHRSMIGRVLNYLTYLFLALVRCLTIRPKPEVIIAMTDPPLACIVGLLTARVRKCKFIYNIQDLQPDMALAAGVVRSGWTVALWERLHRWVLRRGNLIVVPGEDMKERLLGKGVRLSSIAVVRNGAEPFAPPWHPAHPIVKLIRRNFPFVVIYAGNLGFAGSWETILHAAQLLEGENIGMVFVGDGVLRSRLESLSQNLAHVQFLNYLPQDDLPYVLGAGDLHVVTVKRGLEGLVVPSKMYPILMSGRPILAVTPESSEVSRLVRGSRCGLVADPDDAESIARSVLFARDHPGEVSRMGARARDLGQQFNRNDLAKEFVRAIEEVAAA